MGTLQAMVLAEDVVLPLKTKLQLHFSSNHYPPIHNSWIDPAVKAISLGRDYLNFGDELILSKEVIPGKSASDLLEHLHLWPFVEAIVDKECI